ncbi:hypothetical protein DFJ58DRAFT_372218 [Suillus subalutaceus]|uniref:uncharacterized protein n=1 Tax=Suillus subalutaceus TaxID=48586 RepID=UPI001B85E86E|nr:uncharacterized protein DFJ58DRAFT_372218 [Suillus subalutaceus]KAG1854961.1 hypothetical protein DFJ58DRAFT_372218 [Suillus subalutaceus]
MYGQRIDITPAGLSGKSITQQKRTRPISALLVSGIVPCHIAFVPTISEESMVKLVPFGSGTKTHRRYLTRSARLLGLHPPVGLTQSRTTRLSSHLHTTTAPGRFKDTIANLKNRQGFTVNTISEPSVQNAHATVTDAPPGADEWNNGLTKEKYVCVHLRDTTYAPTTRCSGANKSLPHQGKHFQHGYH